MSSNKDAIVTVFGSLLVGCLGLLTVSFAFLLVIGFFLFRVAVASLFWYIVFWVIGVSGTLMIGGAALPYYIVAGLVWAFISAVADKFKTKESK